MILQYIHVLECGMLFLLSIIMSNYKQIIATVKCSKNVFLGKVAL